MCWNPFLLSDRSLELAFRLVQDSVTRLIGVGTRSVHLSVNLTKVPQSVRVMHRVLLGDWSSVLYKTYSADYDRLRRSKLKGLRYVNKIPGGVGGGGGGDTESTIAYLHGSMLMYAVRHSCDDLFSLRNSLCRKHHNIIITLHFVQ